MHALDIAVLVPVSPGIAFEFANALSWAPFIGHLESVALVVVAAFLTAFPVNFQLAIFIECGFRKIPAFWMWGPITTGNKYASNFKRHCTTHWNQSNDVAFAAHPATYEFLTWRGWQQ